MKKVLFCLSLIIGLLVLNQVPSFAMEVTPDMIGGLGDLGYGLLGGATFDFNDSIYAVDDWDNITQELRDAELDAKAKLFLGDYCVRRGIPFEDINPDLPTDAKSFYKSQYFSSNVRTSWNSYKLANNQAAQEEALRFPISPQAFSDWTSYSNFWYKKYIDQFNHETSGDDPYADVPADHLSQIQTINDLSQFNFYFYDFNIDYNNNVMDNYVDNVYNYTWTLGKNRFDDPNAVMVDNSGYGLNYAIVPMPIKTANITGSGDSYILTINNFQDPSYFSRSYTEYGYYSYAVFDQFIYGELEVNYITEQQAWQNYIWDTQNLVKTGTLDELLNWLGKKMRNIDIYVNGDPWYIAGGLAPTDDGILIPDFNDVIGGNDEDPLPAYDVILPDTTDNYGTFDITSLFDLIRQKIADASDSDPTTDGILTGDDVADTFKDRAGEAVDEEDVPIDDILDDSFPYEDTDNYPNLPPIPQIPLDNAFQGTTILSELIDATQQILPEPLALAFWGMIFILFIIGLIKILHK